MDKILEGEEEEEKKEEQKTEEKKETEQPGETQKSQMKPGEGAWLNYDFVPGDMVIFYEDFENVPVGDFPHRLEFGVGNMEVAEWQGERYLRSPRFCKFDVPLPRNLPQDFTVEFTLFLPEGHSFYVSAGSIVPDIHDDFLDNHREYNYPDISWGKYTCEWGWIMYAGLSRGQDWVAYAKVGENLGVINCRYMISGNYVKVYANEMRVANVPNADIYRSDKLSFMVLPHEDVEVATLIGEIRVAEGGKKFLYEELTAKGRVATQGILFDTNSDRICPESTPTLKEMGAMLEDHPELRLLIEGHTDNVGDESFNLQLSEKRAASVKNFLVETYGIDESRLETKGYGETKPVVTNDTPEGRQNNRRVELVKLD